jgi:superfamily II DNA or RNA helicase
MAGILRRIIRDGNTSLNIFYEREVPMELRLVYRDPDKAYVSDMLWLPKKHIPLQAIKDGLQFWDVDGNQAVLRKLWEDTKHHLVCPREYIKVDQYSQFQFPFVDITPKRFPAAGFITKHEPRDEDQRRAYEAMCRSTGGILNLACGKGKTFLALKHAAAIGRPLLVVVHNSYLFNQWVSEAIPFHVELPAGEAVGIIQEDRFDWKRPITVAMIHSLASRFKRGDITDEFRDHFGMVVYDEVHHLSAPLFVTTAPIVTGLRYGLTATEKRADGFDFIYKYHVGDVFYSDLVQKLIPRIYFQLTPVFFDLAKEEVRDKKGELNIGRLRSYMGDLEDSNIFRSKCIQEALVQGRKILAVSHSKNQLVKLHGMFPGSGLVVQETPVEERSDIVRNSRLSFAIASLGFEGLDDPDLDMVFVLLPFKQPNDLQQVMGRIGARTLNEKMTPIMVIFDDVRVGPLHAMCKTMQQNLRDWDKHVAGMPALDYTVLNALKF